MDYFDQVQKQQEEEKGQHIKRPVFSKTKDNIKVTLKMNQPKEELVLELICLQDSTHFSYTINQNSLEHEQFNKYFEIPSQIYDQLVQNIENVRFNSNGTIYFTINVGRKVRKEVTIKMEKSGINCQESNLLGEELSRIYMLQEKVAIQDKTINQMNKKLDTLLILFDKQKEKYGNVEKSERRVQDNKQQAKVNLIRYFKGMESHSDSQRYQILGNSSRYLKLGKEPKNIYYIHHEPLNFSIPNRISLQIAQLKSINKQVSIFDPPSNSRQGHFILGITIPLCLKSNNLPDNEQNLFYNFSRNQLVVLSEKDKDNESSKVFGSQILHGQSSMYFNKTFTKLNERSIIGMKLIPKIDQIRWFIKQSELTQEVTVKQMKIPLIFKELTAFFSFSIPNQCTVMLTN